MIQDLRFALRILARERWFSLVAVLSLAIGIGANTAIFSLINTLMLRPLPVREPRQLVQFLSAYPGDPHMNAFPWASYESFRDRNRSFSDVVASARARFAVSRDGSEPQTVDGLLAYTVSRRTSEMGLRMALGATRGQVMVMVLKSALGLVLAGLAIGIPLAAMGPRVLARFMAQLTVEAPMPLFVAALAMIAVALLAAYVPARRAARVEPVEALRQS